METNHSQTTLYYREPAPLLTAHDKLLELLSTRRGERHIIVLHAYPDPDAISSASRRRAARPSSPSARASAACDGSLTNACRLS